MSENSQAANEYIRTLREMRESYQEFADKEVRPLYTNNDQRDREPPGFFVDSSYLYVRSFDGDNGSRPFANQVYWKSPDIRISPVTDLSAYTRTLNAGETYNISCTVRNRGDMAVPSAKVEFWLTDPTLGFDTRFATHLSLGNVPSTWVNSNTTAVVNFPYSVPPIESGHKCLFARVFSFSPLDIPVDNFALDPRMDRHVAQLNLNIIKQAEPLLFNWIHMPNADQIIEFVPMAPEELFALRHHVLADVAPFRDFPRQEWAFLTNVELVDSEVAEIEVSPENNSLFATTRDPEGIDLQSWRKIRSAVQEVLAAIDAGRTRMADHRDLFAEFREVNGQARRSSFQLHAPDLGLDEGQAVGVHIRSVDRTDQGEGEVLGGLTLLIVGG
jgi:hypothetical protein